MTNINKLITSINDTDYTIININDITTNTNSNAFYTTFLTTRNAFSLQLKKLIFSIISLTVIEL
jgi:hypothetical protein